MAVVELVETTRTEEWSDSGTPKSPTDACGGNTQKKKKMVGNFSYSNRTKLYLRKSIFILLIFFLVLTTACASGAAKELEMKVKIEITSDTGKHELTATLTDNSSAIAFYELLKNGSVTIDMYDYGSFEKVGSLPKSLPRNDKQITTEPGDIILYQGNQITIYYDVNSWNFTKFGKVEDVTQVELKQILGKGDVTAVFSVME